MMTEERKSVMGKEAKVEQPITSEEMRNLLQKVPAPVSVKTWRPLAGGILSIVSDT